MTKVIVYSTPSCPNCNMVKEFLTDNNVDFEEKNVADDRAAAKEMIELSGQQGVPVIVVDDKIVIGFDEEKLKALLKIEG